jgi:hypothetical protein
MGTRRERDKNKNENEEMRRINWVGGKNKSEETGTTRQERKRGDENK